MALRGSLIVLLPVLYLLIGAITGYKVQEYRYLKTQEGIRRIESDRRLERERVVDEAIRTIKEIERQRDTAKLSSDRLRNEISRLRGSSSSCGGKGVGSGSAVDMLAYVSGRFDEISGELAEYADRILAAGLSCEDLYQSIRK